MPVRVRVRIEALAGSSPGSILESVALVNTGYEAQSPDCSLPRGAAKRLGLWPPPPEARRFVVRAYGGRADVFKVTEAACLSVVAPDRKSPPVKMGILLTEADDEIILSDALIQELGIHPLRPRTGTWRFIDESQERPSVPPEHW